MYGWLCKGKNHFGFLSKCPIGDSISDLPAVLAFQSDFLDGNITPEVGTGGTFTRTGVKSYYKPNTDVSLVNAPTTEPCTEAYVFANTLFDNGGISISATITNHLLMASAPATAPWAAYGSISLGNNYATGPDNTALSAGRLRAEAPNEGIRQQVAAFTNVQNRGFCFSVYLKANSGTPTISLAIANDAGTESNTVPYVLTSSWARYDVGFRFSSGVSDGLRITLNVVDGSFMTPADVLFYGAQLEESSTTYGNLTGKPTNFIRTTSAAASSNADVLSYPSSNLSALGSGSVNVWLAPMFASNSWLNNGTKYLFSVNGTDIALALNFDGVNAYLIGFYDGELSSAVITYQANSWQMFTLTWSTTTGKIMIYRNGSLLASANQTLSTVSADTIFIGRSTAGTNSEYINGIVSLFKYYTGVLTEAEVASLYTSELANF